MKIVEAVKYLQDCLEQVAPMLEALDDIQDKLSAAKGELAATQDQVAKANEELARVRKVAQDLAEAESKKHAQTMDMYARQMAAAHDKAQRIQTTVGELDAILTTRRTEHDQLEASFESLRKRLG